MTCNQNHSLLREFCTMLLTLLNSGNPVKLIKSSIDNNLCFIPLAFENRNTCKNKFTEHLQNLICCPYILLSYNMLHLTVRTQHTPNQSNQKTCSRPNQPTIKTPELLWVPVFEQWILVQLEEIGQSPFA